MPPENCLNNSNVSNNFEVLRKYLYKAEEREDCILIQGSAFVINGKAFLIVGAGGIDFLDSLSQQEGVEGIIGNGNALFISKDFKYVYSAQSREELIKCYELKDNINKVNFIISAPIAPLIFLIRTVPDKEEYKRVKEHVGELFYEAADTFSSNPVKFSGSIKSRLRGKFLSSTRVVHCVRRPTLVDKERLFDSYKDIYQVINKFNGHFGLIYSLWNQAMYDVVGMDETRKLSNSYNPTDPVTPYWIKMAKNFL